MSFCFFHSPYFSLAQKLANIKATLLTVVKLSFHATTSQSDTDRLVYR